MIERICIAVCCSVLQCAWHMTSDTHMYTHPMSVADAVADIRYCIRCHVPTVFMNSCEFMSCARYCIRCHVPTVAGSGYPVLYPSSGYPVLYLMSCAYSARSSGTSWSSWICICVHMTSDTHMYTEFVSDGTWHGIQYCIDSFICETWLIHMWDMTHSYVRHDSFICETWLIHMWWHMAWDTVPDAVAARSWVIWLIHMCDMTHSFVWHDSFIRATWLIHTCDAVWYVRTFLCIHRIYITTCHIYIIYIHSCRNMNLCRDLPIIYIHRIYIYRLVVYIMDIYGIYTLRHMDIYGIHIRQIFAYNYAVWIYFHAPCMHVRRVYSYMYVSQVYIHKTLHIYMVRGCIFIQYSYCRNILGGHLPYIHMHQIHIYTCMNLLGWRTCIHAYIHTYIQTNIQTYIHTQTYTNIHRYIHSPYIYIPIHSPYIYIPKVRHIGVPVCIYRRYTICIYIHMYIYLYVRYTPCWRTSIYI